MAGPLLLLFLAIAAPRAAPPEWRGFARRLSGESARVRTAAIRDLRRIPGLESVLRGAFPTKDRFLAFDVAVALGMRELVPALIEYSARDRTAYAYHTLNAVAGPADARRIVGVYLARIADEDLAPAAKMAILDSLARTTAVVPAGELRRLVADPSPEVRESALGYLRYALVRHRRLASATEIFPAFADPAPSLRIRALAIFAELGSRALGELAERLRPELGRCAEDAEPGVRALCRDVRRKVRP